MAVKELTQVGRCNRIGLDTRLASALDGTTADWLVSRRAEVVRRPERLGEIFPAVARTVGRAGLGDGWTVDEAARASLVAALAADQSPDDLATALSGVYRYGDAAEKRAALRALAVAEVADRLGDRALPLLADAIRTNDQRLLAAALGSYATEHLDDAAFRQAVLKCVFTGVPLDLVDGLPDRADDELARMMADFAAERSAAGRDVPTDIRRYLEA
ncbi:MAG TPA: EboA domain-containing protein [Kribbellaceae bacterium]|nr:EboA domain-containing protein [Kribbellaceae bacterium]